MLNNLGTTYTSYKEVNIKTIEENISINKNLLIIFLKSKTFFFVIASISL